MSRSYPCIQRVEASRKSRIKSAGPMELSARRSRISEKTDSLLCINGMVFLLSLLTAAGTIERAPLIAVIALGVMAVTVERIRRIA